MDPRERQYTLEMGIRSVLSAMNVNLQDENFRETPKRVAKFLTEFIERPEAELDGLLTSFEQQYNEMIIVKDISFTALCAHHMLPFTGKAHVGYIPESKVLGLSKLVRITRFYARRLTLQEKITEQVAEALHVKLACKGSMVVIESHHSCMGIRGVAEPNAITITSSVKGVFADPTRGARSEFLKLIGRS